MHVFKCPGKGPRYCAERINHLVMDSPVGTGTPVDVKRKTQQIQLAERSLFMSFSSPGFCIYKKSIFPPLAGLRLQQDRSLLALTQICQLFYPQISP